MERGHIRTDLLGVSYGAHRALVDVSVDIPRRKITAIIGPSGCGKSTLLKAFNRLLELNDDVTITGKVFVDEKEIYDRSQNVYNLRKKMGLLAQKPYPLPMSIYENVTYGLKIHNNIKKDELAGRVERYLRLVGLWDEVKDRLHGSATKLSVGQQQRLSLARGLAIEPEIILGDEPTSALDPFSAERIESKLVELKPDYTIIVVTHNIQQAMKISDHVIFLYYGRVIESGPAKEIFHSPKEEMTQAYFNGEFLNEIWVAKEARSKKAIEGGEGI